MLCKKCGLEMSCAGDKEPGKLPDVLGMDYYYADEVKLWVCTRCGYTLITTE